MVIKGSNDKQQITVVLAAMYLPRVLYVSKNSIQDWDVSHNVRKPLVE